MRMYVMGIYVIVASLIFSSFMTAWELAPVNESLEQQILEYDPEHREYYYASKIPLGMFLKFLNIYKHRPIKDNHSGLRAQGMFFLWYLLKEINPAVVIESGVWRGGSSWMIDQAVPDAEYIAIDPVLKKRVYYSKRATYVTKDFAWVSPDIYKKGTVVAFFDDHQDAFLRVLQASEKGIKHLIFDDNYPPGTGDGKPHLTLATCFALEQHMEKANILKKLIKRYYILPQVVGTTASNLSWLQTTFTNIPSIWKTLDDVDLFLREDMRVFSDDSMWYRWMTYVELY